MEAAERVKDIDAHRKHIVEQLLTLQCPRCSQAFVDFEGCFALTCGRCRGAFCAWCLVDCGVDAHRHVAHCRHNRAPGRAVFGTAEQFVASQKERREQAVRQYIEQLPAHIDRAQLRAACAQDWRELGLNL